MNLFPVAIFHSPFSTKFGVPRQSGVVPHLKGMIVFEMKYRNPDYIRGIDEYEYLWLIWGFSANNHQAIGPTVRPPLLGGNKSVGVFATRSPYRPNPIGLSSVRLVSVEETKEKGIVLMVEGADLMDGTPIYDIKPYLSYADCHEGAKSGFTDTHQWQRLEVVFPDDFQTMFTEEDVAVLTDVLSQDPRPHYHNDPERIYGMTYAGYDVKFKVNDGILKVVGISDIHRECPNAGKSYH